MRFVIIQKISLFSSDGTASTHFFSGGEEAFLPKAAPGECPDANSGFDSCRNLACNSFRFGAGIALLVARQTTKNRTLLGMFLKLDAMHTAEISEENTCYVEITSYIRSADRALSKPH